MLEKFLLVIVCIEQWFPTMSVTGTRFTASKSDGGSHVNYVDPFHDVKSFALAAEDANIRIQCPMFSSDLHGDACNSVVCSCICSLDALALDASALDALASKSYPNT